MSAARLFDPLLSSDGLEDALLSECRVGGVLFGYDPRDDGQRLGVLTRRPGGVVSIHPSKLADAADSERDEVGTVNEKKAARVEGLIAPDRSLESLLLFEDLLERLRRSQKLIRGDIVAEDRVVQFSEELPEILRRDGRRRMSDLWTGHRGGDQRPAP